MSILDTVLTRLCQSERPRLQRRAYPIHAYIGANGSGKSAAAVYDSQASLLAGRKVLSTVRLLDWENPRLCDAEDCLDDNHETHQAAHPLWEPLTSWRQLLDAENCDILMDEVTGVASSRESSGMPAAVVNLLVQLRRRDVTLRWTAPAWARSEKVIRETSQAVTFCTGYLSQEIEGSDRLWRQRRLFRWQTYDASTFEEWTAGKREKLSPEFTQWFYGPGSTAFAGYDTYDSVLSLGHVLDTGRCADCGGRRAPEPCSCADYQQRRARLPRARAHG